MVQPIDPEAGAPRAEVTPAAGPQARSTLAIAVAAVAALYFGREIFVPFALAVLLSFALAPPMTWLRRLHVPRVPAVVLVVALAFLGIFAFGAIVGGQVTQLAGNLPYYQYNIRAKIHALQGAMPSTGLIERASTVLKELGDEIARPEKPPSEPAALDDAPGAGTEAEIQPIPVEIQQPDPAPLQLLQNIVGPLIEPLATTGIVLVFVIFMLLQREDLRDRLIRLAGTHDLQRTTIALDDAAHRVSRYLLMQLVVNVTYGVPIGVGLWLIGVPNPALWGMLAILLRFVPYVGPVVAAIFPLTLAVAVDPGWTMLFWTAALFILLELVSNNVVEPWLYGASTGLSPVAIILAAIFWTWLWGPVGLLLSTPLTVCLVVLGRHVPQLQFLDVILGNEAVLAPEQRFYQRMLAGDPEEATDQAERFLEDRPLVAFYDEVAREALALAEFDRARGALSESRRARLLEGVTTVVENLSDHDGETPAEPDADARPAAPPLPPDWRGAPALCVSARSDIDEAAAVILAHLLDREGLDARPLSCEAVSIGNLRRLDVGGARLVWLSYMNAESFTHARYLARRLRRRLPGVPILIGFWTLTAEAAERRDPLAATGADAVAASFAEAIERTREIAASRAEAAPVPEPAGSAAAPVTAASPAPPP